MNKSRSLILLLLAASSLFSQNIENSYYPFEVDAELNGRIQGKTYVSVHEEDGIVLLQKSSLEPLLFECLDVKYHAPLRLWLKGCPAFFEPCQVSETITLEFEECLQKVLIKIDPQLLKRQLISCTEQLSAPLIRPEMLVAPADWSGFLNIRYGKGLGYFFAPNFQTAPQPFQILSDFSVQHHNWAFSGTINASNRQSKANVLDNFLLIADWPKENTRLFTGEFSPPTIGVMPTTTLLGVGLLNNPYYFNNKRKAPTQEYDFFLPQPAKVDVFVNGAIYSTYDLPAGPHSFKNFPAIPGNNRVALRINDAIGGTQYLDLNYFYDPLLLPKGDSEYALSAGFLKNFNENAFVFSQPLGVAYYRYGLSPTWTSGIYGQVGSSQLQGGFENSFFYSSIKSTIDLGMSWLFSGSIQPRILATFQNTLTKRSSFFWNANFEYLGKRFSSYYAFNTYQDFIDFNNTVIWNASLNLSRKLFKSVNGTLGLGYAQIRNLGSKYRVIAGLSGSIVSNINFSLSAYKSSINTFYVNETGVLLTLSWYPSSSHFNVTTAYDSFSQNTSGLVNYAKPLGGDRSLNLSAGGQLMPHHNSFLGSFNYQGERFEAMGSNDATVTESIDGKQYLGRSGFMIGTSFVFADGVIGLSRPISDSFVMISPSKDLAPYTLQANPTQDDYLAKTLGRIPAVISNVRSYELYTVTIASEDLPFGYDIGENTYFCMPKYKSGTVIKIDNKGEFFAEGTLVSLNGKPLSCIFGELKKRGASSAKALPLFTDRSGGFQIIGMEYGIYDIYFENDKNPSAMIEIKKDTPLGFVDLGTITTTRKDL